MVKHHPFCKDCVNKMVDINNLDTVYDVLKVLDTPFIMDEWNEVCNTFKDNYIGEYLRIVNFRKRKKYSGLGFKDSIFELTDKNNINENLQNGKAYNSILRVGVIPDRNDGVHSRR